MPEQDDVAAPSRPRAPIQLAICIPCRDEVDHEFSRCLAYLTLHLGATLVAQGQVDLNIFHLNGSIIDSSRSRLTQDALAWGATHLLWLDTDMTFPPDVFHVLLSREVDIVGANYITRRHPCQPTASIAMPDKATGFKGTKLYTTEESTGLVEVAGMGFGCVLLRREVFQHIKMPGFLSTYDAEKATWTGEDVYFCQAARAAGLKVWVDQETSKRIGHAGRFVYQHEHANAIRELFEDRPAPRLLVPGEEGA